MCFRYLILSCGGNLFVGETLNGKLDLLVKMVISISKIFTKKLKNNLKNLKETGLLAITLLKSLTVEWKGMMT